MVCQCGYSLVEAPRSIREGGKLPGDLGCFVWLFAVNSFWAGVLAAFTFWAGSGKPDSQVAWLGCFFILSAALSLVETIVLLQRRRFAYNMGMVICWTAFFNLPVGPILGLMLMSGLAKQRHHLDR